ncbi:T9SS type A sorting domain-containing protein [Flavobacterium sp. DGU11]|uniref:T9SS type A sorting domain-containing protein n=1 Tax=Flavobacterium arundinis TaxID=3139143 RepID=A0ABU9HXS1_9FLAO
MMKKLLLIFLLFTAGTTMMFAQFPSVGILGAATPLGWSGNQPDIAMATTDGVTYTLNNISLYTGGLKFRQDNSWPLNWGNTAWPTGTGVQDQGGMDVPVVVGVYDITFNLTTKEYSFVYKFPVIGIRGNATTVDWGSANGDILLSTTDGITYTRNNFTLDTGGLKFRQDNDWPNNWGGATWPSGSGIFNQDGVDIQAQAGSYNITFNRTTLEYNFEQVFISIGMIGSATPAGWDGPDIDMQTADGITYTLNNYTLATGGLKFRENDEWPNNWGGTDWPSGVGIFDQGGVDIPVQAGTYNITFDHVSKVYNFENSQTAGSTEFNANGIVIFPNPAQQIVNVSNANEHVSNINILDVTGKLTASFPVNATSAALDISALSAGIYFVQISTEKNIHTVKFIKN